MPWTAQGWQAGGWGTWTPQPVEPDPVWESRLDPGGEPGEVGHWDWVAVEDEEVYGVDWTAWATTGDERVCPECGPLDGAVWEEDAGDFPPLHVNCRCSRVYAFTEWRTRPVTRWEEQWIQNEW